MVEEINVTSLSPTATETEIVIEIADTSSELAFSLSSSVTGDSATLTMSYEIT